MQREGEPFNPEDLVLEGDMEPAPEFHIFDNPQPEPDFEDEDDDYEPDQLRRITDLSGEATKGQDPKRAPAGAAGAVAERCNEEPFVGHIRIGDLAEILGISHWPLLSLRRSFRGHVTFETAMKEVYRRGG